MKTDQVSRYDLKIAAKCPKPGHKGSCQFSTTPQLEAAALPGSTRATAPGTFVAQADLNATERFFEGAHADLFRILDTLDFHMLPYLTPLTPEFAEETGLADCRIAAQLLLREAAARGLPARPASGYFMAAPFPMKHVWIQLEIDGEWVSADPFLLKSFAEWGIVDPQVWPQHRSLHGILWPVDAKTSVESDIVMHAETVVEASITIAGRETVA